MLEMDRAVVADMGEGMKEELLLLRLMDFLGRYRVELPFVLVVVPALKEAVVDVVLLLVLEDEVEFLLAQERVEQTPQCAT